MAYHIARDNQQLGVFDETQVRDKFAAGELRNTDLAWTEGMAEWRPLGEVMAGALAPEPVSEVNPYAPPGVQTYGAATQTGTAPLATLGQRLGAALLDGVMFFVAYIPLVLAFGVEAFTAAAQGQVNPEELPQVEPNMGLLGLSVVLVLTLAVINIVMLAKRGQTIGKRIVGTRVVGVESDENPGWVKTIILRAVVNGIITSVPFIGGVYALVDILFIFREDRRCIHDLLAGTRVVQGQPSL